MSYETLLIFTDTQDKEHRIQKQERRKSPKTHVRWQYSTGDGWHTVWETTTEDEVQPMSVPSMY